MGRSDGLLARGPVFVVERFPNSQFCQLRTAGVDPKPSIASLVSRSELRLLDVAEEKDLIA